MNFKFQISLFVYLFIGLFVYLSIAASSEAACTPVYGGGPSCTDSSLTIQKQVLNPTTNRFVHNLGLSDPLYQANDLVTFQITLTNNGSSVLQNITVKDNFPSILVFADGPGKFDKKSNTLTFSVPSLPSHHSQLYTISGRIVFQNEFTQNKFCVSNKASALAATGTVTQDSSQFCIQKLTDSPATGPEALGLIAIPFATILGFGVKKFTKRLS